VNLGDYLRFLDGSLLELAEAFSDVAEAHPDEPDVRIECTKFARTTMRQRELLDPFLEQLEPDDPSGDDPHRLFDGTRQGPLGLLRDVHDLWLMSALQEFRVRRNVTNPHRWMPSRTAHSHCTPVARSFHSAHVS